MHSLKPEMSRRGKIELISWTFFGTLACILISVTYNYIVFRPFGGQILEKALVAATVLPVVLAGPLFYYMTLKLRELAIVNHRLEDVAATDSLTDCLNRRAFTSKVDHWLGVQDGDDAMATGAFLIVDADHFKEVNDRFGHQSGDEALRLIAGTIKTVVRSQDYVGRLGGEEFGIFLPGTDQQSATVIAERIRKSVADAGFLPQGSQWHLTVSVGVVVFTRPMDFSELFRIADERLYRAKELGRDRVEVRRMVPNIEAASNHVH